MGIYFIRQGDDGPIKIGTAVNPRFRVRELQPGNHETLRIMTIIPGGLAEERELHQRFADLRISRTDWFRSEARLVAFVEGMVYALPEESVSLPVPEQTLFGLSRDQVLAVVGAVEIRALKIQAIDFVEETTARAWRELNVREYRAKISLTTIQFRAASKLLCALEQTLEYMTNNREHPIGAGAGFVETSKEISDITESIQAIVEANRLANAEDAVPHHPSL